MSKAKNLSLEILTESDELRKIDPKGQVLIPRKQREEAGMEPGDIVTELNN